MRSSQPGITRSAWRGTGFGTAFGDFDNDGDLDLSVVNGRVLRAGKVDTNSEAAQFWKPYAQRDQLFLNDGNGKFADVSDSTPDFSEHAGVSRGLACGDINNDGTLDVVVTSIAGPTRIFTNAVDNSNHWLGVRAFDASLKRDAYGARVELHLGTRVLKRDVNPGYSYLSSNDPRAHFGLGSYDQYESLRIQWPDGSTEEFPGGPADRIIQVNRGQGTLINTGQTH